MTQAQLGLRQSFPAGRTLTVRNERFRHMAAEMNEQADARRRDVLQAVRIAWLNVFFWTEAGKIVSESRPYFKDLVEVTRAMYSVGRRDQQDLLRAELELSRLEDRLIEIRRQHASAQASLGEWVGAAAARPLAPQTPSRDPLPDLEVLRAGLAHHPLVEAAGARVDAGGSGIELARQQYRPGWDLDVGYGYREGELPDGDSRPDMFSVSVTLDLPLFRRNRQDQMVKAAVSDRAAAEASRDELLRRLAGDLEAEYAHFRELDRRVALYDERILTQAAGQSQAALAAYQSDAADFADVMRGYIDALDARLERERLSVLRAQTRARLANLGGLDDE
jgi:outer membrane protein TolC